MSQGASPGPTNALTLMLRKAPRTLCLSFLWESHKDHVEEACDTVENCAHRNTAEPTAITQLRSTQGVIYLCCQENYQVVCARSLAGEAELGRGLPGDLCSSFAPLSRTFDQRQPWQA